MVYMSLTGGTVQGPVSTLGILTGLWIWLSLLHGSSAQIKGKYGYFAKENSSSVVIKSAVWDVRGTQQTQFTFRTCSNGELLYQKGTSSADFFKLLLRNGSVEFSWSVGTNQSNVTIGNKLNNDEWWTLNIQRFLGNLYLNVTQSGKVRFSEIISNSTFRNYFSNVNFAVTDGLYVGRNFTGCMIEGPTVIFSSPSVNILSSNVIWSNTSCPIHDASCAIATSNVTVCYLRPCTNGGTCLEKQDHYECVCPHLYNGTNCEFDLSGFGCAVAPCLNGGNCSSVNGTSTGRNYKCHCPQGYTGVNCEALIDECGSNPCRNNVPCYDRVGSFECNCTGTGYNGTLCDEDIDECQNTTICGTGQCFNNPGSFTCGCAAGFIGTECKDIDECDSSPCRNGATCQNLANAFKCTCAAGYTGIVCELDINECLNVTCPNFTECQDRVNGYQCVCKSGYTGTAPNCIDIDECQSNPCRNGATCMDKVNGYECQCATGFNGSLCDNNINDCPTVSKCLNGGTCVDLVNSYKCACARGYTGTYCETDIDECTPNPCGNNSISCMDGIGNYTCRCKPGYEGFQGLNCSDVKNECKSVPCQNNGTCVENTNNYTCVCNKNETISTTNRTFLTGYTGANCEMDINECAITPSICLNGGTCENSNGTFVCKCGRDSQGVYWSGAFCEVSTSYCYLHPDYAANPPICKNNGTCVGLQTNYRCDCKPGFTGRRCETDINECESNPCRYNGTCHDRVNGYNCSCIPGITGANCEIDIDECASYPCLNGGQCIDRINRFECNCTDTGFKNTTCNVNIDDCEPHPCQNGATCNDMIKDYNCSCYLGYTGKDCNIDVNECASTPCQYNSTCLQKSNKTLYDIDYPGFENLTFSYATAAGYLCQCTPGSKGVNCEIDINDCEFSPCVNGTCKDLFNNFTCLCSPGYEGRLCNVEINECLRYDPCKFGSNCTDKIADWSCKCPPFYNGKPYAGKNCTFELTACANNECKNGATCKPYLINETRGLQDYDCWCTEGFTGRYCNISTTMSFDTGSYIQTTLNVSIDVNISFRFRTTLQDSILFAWKGNKSSVAMLFTTVELKGGKLFIGYHDTADDSLRNQPISDQKFNDGNWKTVNLTKTSSSITVSFKGSNCDALASNCSTVVAYNASIQPTAEGYFGSLQMRSLINQTVSKTEFVGCMEDVTIWGTRLSLNITTVGSSFNNLTKGCPRVVQCEATPCNAKGDCLDLWNKFRCDCYRPNLGVTCQTAYVAATFAHNAINTSSAEFDVSSLQSTLANGINLSFFIRTQQPSALIMYIGNMAADKFVTLELFNGNLKLRLKFCGIEKALISSQVTYNSGEQHLAQIYKNTTTFQFYVDGALQHSESAVLMNCIFDPTYLYFGGKRPGGASVGRKKREMSVITTDPNIGNLSSLNWYKGTIQDVQLNQYSLQFYPLADPALSPLPKLNASTSSGLTKDEVTDSICNTTSPCENNSTCTDVFFNDYRCDCLLGYRGKNCHDLDFCVTGKCPDGSTCKSLFDGFECISTATFGGQKAYDRATYTNTLNSTQVTKFSFKFRTLAMNGYIFMIGNNSRYYKARLVGENLKIVYKLDDSAEMVLTANFTVADSRWYTAKVSEYDSAVTLTLLDDKEVMYVNVSGSKPVNSGSLNKMLKDQGSKVYLANDVPGVLNNWKVNLLTYHGCLKEFRIGNILLPFFTDDQFINNTSKERFLLQPGHYFTRGCVSPTICEYHQCRHNSVCIADFYTYVCNCTEGYAGRWCQDQANYCVEGSCLHGRCVNKPGGYQCLCPPGYNGNRCETDLDECKASPCLNNGTCQNTNGSFTCNCMPQYVGNTCEISLTENCSNNPCQHGSCVMVNTTHPVTGTDIQTFNCSCYAGYEGDKCEIPINYCTSFPCENGGTCTSNNVTKTYSCACPLGYTGDRCQTNINDCLNSNCQNGGVCVDGLNTFTCNCTPSKFYTGEQCNVDIDECNMTQPCQNGGTCFNTLGSPGFQCLCSNTGFEGLYCETDINECDVPSTCKHGSMCTNTIGDFNCNCTLGYQGKDCGTADCGLVSCQNNGTCNVRGTDWSCACPEYYEGQLCLIKGPCADKPCYAANTVICKQNVTSNTYICNCKTGWEGQTCTDDINECSRGTHRCENGATCNNTLGSYGCLCPPGYVNQFCETNFNECSSSPCQNNGKCIDGIAEFECNCTDTGYQNLTCSEDLDECTDNDPCYNGATCTNSIGSYTCTCTNGFEGPRCEVKAAAIMKDDITWYIVGPVVALVLILITIGFIWFLLCVRNKRATRGAYSPSRQEVTGSRVELGNVMKKPPLERLI